MMWAELGLGLANQFLFSNFKFHPQCSLGTPIYHTYVHICQVTAFSNFSTITCAAQTTTDLQSIQNLWKHKIKTWHRSEICKT